MFARFLSRFAFYRTHTQQKLQQQSIFYQKNRKKVLITYRHFLKLIPQIYPRTLQQAQKLNEVRWIYKESKQLPTIYEVQGRTKLATQLLDDLKKGYYGRLRDFVPHRMTKQRMTTTEFLSDSTPKKKKWWRGHIY